MTTIDEIEVSDFCQIGHALLKPRGLIWVGGRNDDTEAATNNGCGKSNLLNSIGWCWFGEMPGDELADDVIRVGAKMAMVRISTNEGWQVTRERHKGSPKLTLIRDGVRVKGRTKEIQAQINDLLGMDWSTYRSIVLHTQDMIARFISSETSNAERQEVLFKLTGSSIFRHCVPVVRAMYREAQEAVSSTEREIESSKAALRVVDLSSLKREESEWKERRASEVADIERELGEVASKLSVENERLSSADIRKRLEEIDSTVKRARSEEDSRQAKGDAIADRVAELRLELKRAQRRSEALSEVEAGGVCPECGNELRAGKSADHWRKERSTLANHIRNTENLLNLEQSKLEKARAAASELKGGPIGRLRVERERLRAIRAERKWLKGEKNRLLEAKKRLLDEDANPYSNQIARARSKRKRLKTSIEECEARLDDQRSELAHIAFWRSGFSSSGLPSFFLDSVMPTLTDRVNHYLDILSDGDISVCFSTQKELASGEMREGISIKWEIEGVQNRSPSGGQKRKLAIATAMSLIDLAESSGSNSVGLLILDEILDGLDKAGRSRLVTLLYKLKKRSGCVFAISHDDGIAEVFDSTVMVIKKSKLATVEAA